MLRTRLATAAIALPALWLIVEYLPPHLFAGFIMAVAAMALLEYFAMALPGDAVERTAGVLWGLVIAGGVASRQSDLWGAGLALAVISGLMFPLLHPADLPRAMLRLGLSLLGVLYVGFFPPHFVLLREADHDLGWRWVLFTVFAAMGSDSGGYLTGRAFGRHKLAPSISPSKTVEGALGALAGAMVIATICHLVFFAELGAARRSCWAPQSACWRSSATSASRPSSAPSEPRTPAGLSRDTVAFWTGWTASSSPSCSRTTTPFCHGPEGDDGHPFPLGDGAVVLGCDRRARLRARARALRGGQAIGRAGGALLDRLRSGGPRAQAGRDRVRRVGHPAGRLREDAR